MPLKQEHKQKLRQAKLGKKLTKEHSLKISQSLRGKKQNPEWAEKRAAAQRKRLRCIDNGLEFDGLKFAAQWVFDNGLGKNHKAQISECCLGRIEKAHGLRWEYI